MPSTHNLEKQKKKVAELAEIFKNSGVYLFDYRGLSVAEMEDLRGKIRDVNAHLKVVKNRLAIKYFEKEKKEYGREIFSGPTAIAYATENFTDLAKIIVEFEKNTQKIKIKSGFIETSFADAVTIKNVAKLPGRDQLIAQFASLMVMPLKKLAMTLASPLTSVAILLNNLKDKKAKEENNG